MGKKKTFHTHRKETVGIITYYTYMFGLDLNNSLRLRNKRKLKVIPSMDLDILITLIYAHCAYAYNIIIIVVFSEKYFELTQQSMVVFIKSSDFDNI